RVSLCDEPLSNLDAQLRVQMRTEIKELHQRLQTTSVYVTHDQIEAMTMADRIVVMRDGVVEQTGGHPELYDHPVNTFVAGFIGSPAMNMLPGKGQRNGTGGDIVFANGERPGPPRGIAVADRQPVACERGSAWPLAAAWRWPTGSRCSTASDRSTSPLAAAVCRSRSSWSS